jgi:hypothetical protein
MKAPAIPMRRSPRNPNPVTCTIWPASHPAMRPTSNMISRLSPDMCIFVASSCINKLTNFRQAQEMQVHQRRAWKVTIRLFKEEGNHSPALLRTHAKGKTEQNCSPQEVCRFYPHADANAAPWGIAPPEIDPLAVAGPLYCFPQKKVHKRLTSWRVKENGLRLSCEKDRRLASSPSFSAELAHLDEPSKPDACEGCQSVVNTRLMSVETCS